jgi:hypothetical protein
MLREKAPLGDVGCWLLAVGGGSAPTKVPADRSQRSSLRRPARLRGVTMDDDDKVRRNLVVASAAVILAWFLELPVQRLAAASKIDQWFPPPRKVWLASLAVLVYLAWRYRFSDMGKRVLRRTRSYYRKLVSVSVHQYVSARFDPRRDVNTILDRNWSDMCDAVRRANLVALGDQAHSYDYRGFDILQRIGRQGIVEVKIVLTSPGEGIPGSVQARFQLPRGFIPRMHVYSALAAIVYSEHAVERLFPTVLWICAIGVCITRFLHNY